MAQYQPDEKAKLRRQRSERAVQLAMQNKWDDAIAVNRSILDLFPNDVDAFNRLGKALMELGRFGEAKAAYAHAVENDPNNSIARKNLARLTNLKESEGEAVSVQKLDPRLFIEETGKTGLTKLINLGPREALAKLTAGEAVRLEIDGNVLHVFSARGEPLGDVQPKLGLRIIKLTQGGNQYVSAVTSLTENSVEIIIRETYQHPSQAGRVSFPTQIGPEGAFRGYIRESVLRYDVEDEDEEGGEEGEYAGDWSEEHDASTGDEVTLDYEDDTQDKDDGFDND